MSSKESCKQAPGVFVPVINRNDCEGKGACVTVCPMSVFVVDTLPAAQRINLSIKGKVKGFVHRWQQALLVRPEACEACGLWSRPARKMRYDWYVSERMPSRPWWRH